MSRNLRLALDATYAAYPDRTGIGIYSDKLIAALAGILAAEDARRYEPVLAFRPGPYLRWARRRSWPAPFTTAAYLDPWLQFPAAALFHGLSQRLPRKRYPLQVVTLHEHFPRMEGQYSTPEFQRHLSRQITHALGQADRIIVVSESVRSHLERHDPTLASRIRVVHHGVDAPGSVPPDELSAFLQATPRIAPGERFFLNVGAVQTRKNIVNAARALKALPSRRLVVAGADGYGAGEIREQIGKEGMQDRVLFLGHAPHETLRFLYSAAAALVFPSLEEAFGLPILEAMSHGLPVITSNTSAMPEVAGGAALLVDPHSVEQIREAMRRVAEDADLARQLSQKGRERAREFSWDRCARKTWEVYAELLGDG